MIGLLLFFKSFDQAIGFDIKRIGEIDERIRALQKEKIEREEHLNLMLKEQHNKRCENEG